MSLTVTSFPAHPRDVIYSPSDIISCDVTPSPSDFTFCDVIHFPFSVYSVYPTYIDVS